MARGLRWKIPFKTIKERSALINIYKDGYTGNDVTVLEAAVNAFETQEDTDRDMLKPVRTQTGYIRVIDNGDIDGLTPTDNRQHYIEFLIDGELKWCGYMQADTFSEDWDVTPLEVEFPIISGMGVLDSIPMDQTKEMELISLCSLLLECIDETRIEYEYIYIPKEIAETNTSQFYLLPLDLRISRFNFFDINDSVNIDDPEWERYDADTYNTFLEEFCKFWGWTLYERGKNLFFISVNDVEYMRISVEELRNSIDFLIVVSYYHYLLNSKEIARMELAGDSHKKDVLQGYKKVIVNAKINGVGEVVPEIDKDEMVFVERYSWDTNVDRVDYKDTFKLYKQKDRLGLSEFTIYSYNKDDKIYSKEEEYTEIQALTDGLGAMFVERDRTKSSDWNKKRNYDWEDIIRVRLTREPDYMGGSSIFPTEAQSNNMPILKMIGEKEAFYTNGAFVINGTTSGEHLSSINGSTNGACIIPAVFRVGNKYWNGTRWVSSYSIFKIRCGNQDDANISTGSGKIVSTKTIDMPYNGADGYVIPIKETISGVVEMIFLFPWEDKRTDTLYITNLNVKYYQEDSNDDNEKDQDKKENKYSIRLNKGYDKDFSIDLAMASNNSNKAAYSILSNSPWMASGSSVESLYFVGEGMIRPELHLLGILKQLYGRITEKLTLEMEYDDTVSPLTRLTRSGKRYAVLSESINWADETVEYIIEDLPNN